MSDGRTKRAYLTAFRTKGHVTDERGFLVRGSGLAIAVLYDEMFKKHNIRTMRGYGWP